MTYATLSTVARRYCIAMLVFASLLASLSAQTAPAASSPAPADNNGTIVLTPFQVTTDQDRGYAAGNTVSGGRIDTPLALTAASVSVMTKEFLDDFAITDMNQAAAFTLNMDVSVQPNQGPFGTDRFEANFRGAGLGGSGSYPTRNGIQNYFVADSYNSERFEFQRGPNAQMFGPGGPGGMQGSSSKRPRYNSRPVSSTFRVDTYGGYRATLDYNQGFDRVAFRVNALHQHNKSYLDGTSDKQNAITAAVAFKITQSTELRMEYEKSSEYNIQYRKTWGDNASYWDRRTVNENNTTIANAGNFGISTINTGGDTLVYNANTRTFINYGRTIQYQTFGVGFQVPWKGRPDLAALGVPNFHPGFPKDFRFGPIDNIADRDNNTRSIALEHRFTPSLSAHVSWTGSDIDPTTLYSQGHGGDFRVDVNRTLPPAPGSPAGTLGAPNPNFGKRYVQWTQNSQHQQNGNEEYLGMVNYQFAVPRWFDMKQNFNFNAGHRVGRYEAWDRRFRWMNNPNVVDPFSGNNQIQIRVYEDNPTPTIATILDPVAINQVTPGYQFRNLGSGFHAYNKGQLWYGNLVSRTSFFDDRINISVGIRRDRVTNDNLSNIANGNAANDYQIIMGGANPATGQNEPGFHSVLTTYRTSKNGDFVTYPFKGMRNKWIAPIGFVVNFSQNFQVPPTGGPLIDGTRPLPPFSETLDLGLRYSVPGGVAYATLSYYDTDQLGQLSGFGTSGNIQNIWRNLGYTDDAHYNFGGYRDTADRKLNGWEFELTANPTRNLTFTANFSRPSVKTVVESRYRQAYVAENIAEWRAGALQAPGATFNGRTIIDPQVIANEIINIENSLNGLTTGTMSNLSRKRINLAGSYRFTEGKLRGVGVNAGLNYRGEIKSGSRDARLKFQTTAPTIAQTVEAAFDYLYVPSTYDYSMGANYTRSFGRYRARFQVNVTNPFNDDDPRWTGYSVISAGAFTNQANNNALTVPGSNPRMQVYGNFSQLEPRKFTFTTTLSF
jgi:outer membrane receptor protein involved in Fe transport